MSKLFESAQVGSFMYMWGYADAVDNRPHSPGLLVNSQNVLDHLVGDLFGAVNPSRDEAKTERRWFLAEFKRERNGFYQEVHYKNAKPHRRALYSHLREDFKCRQLARFGHFAIWGDDENELIIEPYAHAVRPGPAGGPGPGLHELDTASVQHPFMPFYRALHMAQMRRHYMDVNFYGQGLGLPCASMQKYLACMLQFCVPLPTSPTIINRAAQQLLFGFTEADASSGLALTSFEGLLSACARFAAKTQPPKQRLPHNEK